jgi:LCP family protein required for cell wall assembly
MSNFEDYDLRRSARPTGSRPANRRPAGARPSSTRPRTSSLSYDFEDEFERELESESMAYRRPASASSASHRSGSAPRRRPTSSHSSHQTAKRKPASHASHSTASKRPSSSRARGGSKKAQKKKLRRNVFIVEIVLILVLLIVLFFWNKFGKVNWDNINMEELENTNLDEETKEVLSQYTTIALFGVDNRTNGNLDSGNSDTIILVSINNDTKDVKMVSVQRDTYLKVGEDKYRKCNYAYAHGGVEEAIEMLNTNLDLNISGYVSVDFYALAKIVDDLGGLDLEVTQRMIDTENPETHINALAGYIAEVENVLKYYPDEEEYWKHSDCFFDSPGVYHMNGPQVVGYCRNRYAVDNDYGRAENQRKVIKLIVEKAKKADVGKLNKIADDVFPKISTSLKLTQCLGLAAGVKDYTMAESAGFPFDLKGMKLGQKGYIIAPCTLESNVAKLHQLLYNQTDYDTSEALDEISKHIVNETGATEASADVTQKIDNSGE